MSKTGKIDKVNINLNFPPVNIIQYSFITTGNRLLWTNPNRNAPFWRFYWNLTTGAKIIFNDHEIELLPEKIVLIPPNITYASIGTQTFSQLYMHFTWDIDIVVKSPLELSVVDEMKLLADVENWFEKDEPFFAVRMYAILLRYLVSIPAGLNTGRASDPRIGEAVRIMNENVKISNKEIAHVLHMSCDNFQRLFKCRMGTSPHQYLLGRRMEKAQSLLLNPLLSVEEIAQMTGFSNRYQFSKTFNSYFKVSPATYRKSYC